MMELKKGQVVQSRAGRDVTKLYVVLAREADRVLLADGAKRTLQAPKKKNLRHLQPTNTVLPPGQIQTDLEIKRALAAYAEKTGLQQKTQGG